MQQAENQFVYQALLSSTRLSDDGSVVVDADGICFNTLFDQVALSYADVDRIEFVDYTLRIHSGAELFTASRMGAEGEWCFQKLCAAFGQRVLEALGVEGKPEFEAACVYALSENGTVHRTNAVVQLFSDCLCVLSPDTYARRVPYVFMTGLDYKDYTLTVRVSEDECYAFSQLGREGDALYRELTERIPAVREKNCRFAEELDGALGMAQAAQAASLLPEGLTVPFKAIEALPSLKKAVEKRIQNSRLKESLNALSSLCDLHGLCVGICRVPEEQVQALLTALAENQDEDAAQGAVDEDSLRWKLWAAVASRDGQTAIVEFALPGEDTATYLFRTGGDFSKFVSALSRALEASGLKRELFSLSEEKLTEAEHTQDRILLSRTPSIQTLRNNFAGRAVHRSTEGWLSQIRSFLDKNQKNNTDEAPKKPHVCSQCGASLTTDAKFCSTCGARTATEE